nr:MAG TPA: hypothetical protein [Caudoviricetes sp.]
MAGTRHHRCIWQRQPAPAPPPHDLQSNNRSRHHSPRLHRAARQDTDRPSLHPTRKSTRTQGTHRTTVSHPQRRRARRYMDGQRKPRHPNRRNHNTGPLHHQHFRIF